MHSSARRTSRGSSNRRGRTTTSARHRVSPTAAAPSRFSARALSWRMAAGNSWPQRPFSSPATTTRPTGSIAAGSGWRTGDASSASGAGPRSGFGHTARRVRRQPNTPPAHICGTSAYVPSGKAAASARACSRRSSSAPPRIRSPRAWYSTRSTHASPIRSVAAVGRWSAPRRWTGSTSIPVFAGVRRPRRNPEHRPGCG